MQIFLLKMMSNLYFFKISTYNCNNHEFIIYIYIKIITTTHIINYVKPQKMLAKTYSFQSNKQQIIKLKIKQ